MNLHDPNTYAGEKGGANGDLIKNNPAFARTRENMNEFAGCGMAVRAIRQGLLNLLPEQTDKHFTARLMKVTKDINRRDFEGTRGKRTISFSSNQPMLAAAIFNVLELGVLLLNNFFIHLHPITRGTATLSLTGLNIKPVYVPEGATHYRIQNHISIISDYGYNDLNRQYEPLSQLNTMNAFVYSDYTPVDTALTDELVAAFPVGTAPQDADSVIQAVGIEFYVKNGLTAYLPLKVGSSMMIVDVF